MPPVQTQTKKRQERSRRERAARRSEILRAARHEFAVRGFRNATLEQIAARAGFGKGTMYNYFKDKADLFAQVILSLLDDLAGLATEAVAGGGTGREVFERFAVRAVHYYADNEDVLRIVVRDMNRLLVERGEGHIRDVLVRVDGISSRLAGALGTTRSDAGAEPMDLARAFFGLLHFRSMRWVHYGRMTPSVDPVREGAFITRLFFDGAAAYLHG